MVSGNLVIGTAAAVSDGWPGRLLGLAIYNRELSPDRVLESYRGWIDPNRPRNSNKDGAIAFYHFDKGYGRTIPDEELGKGSLYMPPRYLVPAKRFLAPPSLGNHLDIVSNIIGFIPLGFTLCGYLVSSRRESMGVLSTIVICGVFSLLMESLQIFLPTRDSDMTDVISNTLGGGIGAFLYSSVSGYLRALKPR
jgi:VanZ family protein